MYTTPIICCSSLPLPPRTGKLSKEGRLPRGAQAGTQGQGHLEEQAPLLSGRYPSLLLGVGGLRHWGSCARASEAGSTLH